MRQAETLDAFSRATVGQLWTAVLAAASMQLSLANEALWPAFRCCRAKLACLIVGQHG